MLWGFKVLLPQPYMPLALGGSGDLRAAWAGWPYSPHTPQLKELILVLSGYHMGGLVTHFATSRKNDFIEMGLHHIVAMYLYLGCYLFNGWEIGAVIALIHDIADVTTGAVKTSSETRYSTLTAIIFVTHMSVWFYTRLILLPWTIYSIYLEPVYMGRDFVKPTFMYLLTCMFLLHAYWFSLFCKMLKKYIGTG